MLNMSWNPVSSLSNQPASHCSYFQGHSSFVTHIDWSVDGEYLQSNSGDYELLYCEYNLNYLNLVVETWETLTKRLFKGLKTYFVLEIILYFYFKNRKSW